MDIMQFISGLIRRISSRNLNAFTHSTSDDVLFGCDKILQEEFMTNCDLWEVKYVPYKHALQE